MQLTQPISITENIDCMEFMQRFPDNYFDLAVVDPPYGIADKFVRTGFAKTEKESGYKKYKKFRGQAEFFKGEISDSTKEMEKWDVRPPEAYYHELKRVSKNQIIWGANYLPEVMEVLGVSRCWICWDKCIPDNFTQSQFELAYTSFNKISKTCVLAHRGYVGFAPKAKGPERAGLGIHPTQKPIPLYDWIIDRYAKPGDKILDTHLGSGSSRISANKAGLDFWACELDPEYFADEEKRYKNFVSQLRMF